jgi:hypothetical protein
VDLEGSGDTGDMQEYLKLLIIIGEFSPLGEGQQRNEIVPLELLTKEQQSPEVYIGEKSVREVPGASSEGLKRFMLEVVFEPTAWLYGWNSGRYKTETRHAFQVSVLSPKDDAASDLLRLASFESPSFVINSHGEDMKEGKGEGEGDQDLDQGLTFPACNPVKRIDFIMVRNNSDTSSSSSSSSRSTSTTPAAVASILRNEVIGTRPSASTGKG